MTFRCNIIKCKGKKTKSSGLVYVSKLQKFQLRSKGLSPAACPTTLAICYLLDSKDLNDCVCLQ